MLDYIWENLQYGTPYNPVNTLAFALGLILALWLIKKVSEKKNWKFDKNFLYMSVPYIVFGGILRVWEDYGILQHPVFISPGIFFVTFAVFMACWGLSRPFKNKDLLFRNLGIALCLVAIARLPVINVFWFLLIVASSAVTAFIAYKLLKKRYFEEEDWLLLQGHMLDGFASSISIAYLGYSEQHVFPGFLMGVFGPWVMVPLKLAVVIPVVYIINRDAEKEWKWLLKLAVLVLGLGPGVRDVVRVLAGT